MVAHGAGPGSELPARTDIYVAGHSHFIPMESPQLTAKLIAGALTLL
jgi:hypothetical protein